MKVFALLALSLIFVSCKPDQSEEASKEPEARISGEEHAKLIHQKLELEKDLGLIIAHHDSDGVTEIEATKDRLNEAYISLRKIQGEHPLLKPLTMKLSDWNFHLRRARQAGDTESEKAASSEILKINQQLEDLSKEQPEIIEAREQIDLVNEDLNRIRRELAGRIPDAKHLLEALNAIEKKLIEVTE